MFSRRNLLKMFAPVALLPISSSKNRKRGVEANPLPLVRVGDKIKASTFNALIERVNALSARE